jgi:hypothetical protein
MKAPSMNPGASKLSLGSDNIYICTAPHASLLAHSTTEISQLLILDSTRLWGTMSGDPVIDSIRQDLLYRLHWNFQDPLEEVTIAVGNPDQAVNVALFGHPLATESLANPPLNCIDEITIRDFGEKQDRELELEDEPEEEEFLYKPPPALKIWNENGNAITLGQFVTKVHEYVSRNMEEILRVKGELYGELVTHADGSQMRVITEGRPVRLPSDIGVYFTQVRGGMRDGRVILNVTLFADGEWDISMERFWARQSSQAVLHEQPS